MRESADCSCAGPVTPCAQHRRMGLRATAQSAAESGASCVLLVTADGDTERALVRSLKKCCMAAELARSMPALQRRVARDDLAAPEVVFLDLELPDATTEDWVCLVRQSFSRAALVAFGEDLNAARAARLLGFGVPSLHKPVAPLAFARLASELCQRQTRPPRAPADSAAQLTCATRGSGLDLALESYASVRALSNQQRLILRFYLSGENDKQIARTLLCSEATVYEHWRRMGKKAGGSTKFAVITDFHRFLVHN